ncbi:MAG: hypothetical protein Q4D38_12855 [Planctomycetia bacterium]|nr:hypothetical protein [Planctomycetia bacterium]
MFRQTCKSYVRTLGILVSIALGLSFPQLHHLGFCIPLLLVCMLFLVFLRVSAPIHALHWSHAFLLGWNILFGPVAFFIVRYLGGSEDLALAALFAAMTPTGTAAPVVMGFLDGKVEYVILAFLLTTLGFVLFTPIILPFFLAGGTSGLTWTIFLSIASLVFPPAILAAVCRKCIPSSREWYRKTSGVSFLMWNLCLLLMSAQTSEFIWTHGSILSVLLTTILVTFFVCATNFTVGFLLGGKIYAHECSQSLGQKNTAVTFYVAITYANPAAALGPCTYILWHNLWNATQMGFHKRSDVAQETEGNVEKNLKNEGVHPATSR